jgi:hypothetical protein
MVTFLARGPQSTMESSSETKSQTVLDQHYDPQTVVPFTDTLKPLVCCHSFAELRDNSWDSSQGKTWHQHDK